MSRIGFLEEAMDIFDKNPNDLIREYVKLRERLDFQTDHIHNLSQLLENYKWYVKQLKSNREYDELREEK